MADSLEATVDDVAAMAANEATATQQEAVVEEDPEVLLRRQYNRREFMTGVFAASTGLLLAGGGWLSYKFMFPIFKAGTFGGLFPMSLVDTVPESPDIPPVTTPDGKFHLVQTDEGELKAIYMVCTHLGCLYKWQQGNWRFECPCHGSKFTHDGLYIEGPAARSLDYFAIVTEPDGTMAVDTGSKILGGPATESPARIVS